MDGTLEKKLYVLFTFFVFAFDRAFWVTRGTREITHAVDFFILYAGV